MVDHLHILVTGATGFLGQHLVRRLLQRGYQVTGIGRSLVRGAELEQMGAMFRPVDICDAAGVSAAISDVDMVVHAAAVTDVFAPWRRYLKTNVNGTQNVVDACVRHRVQRLLFISSPAVVSQFAHQFNLTEDAPSPRRYTSMYARSKAMGEQIVAAAAYQLETVVLRPRAIYGTGDTAVFPRIMKAMQRGRLPILNQGQTVTNLTHVSDVVTAIGKALIVPDAAGKTYFITGGEDVLLYDVFEKIAAHLGVAAPSRHIKTSSAMGVARWLEWFYAPVKARREPPITRYSVSLLSWSQTYCIDAARRDLDYCPKVKWREGVADFLEGLQQPAPQAETSGLNPAQPALAHFCSVAILNTGVMRVNAGAFGVGTWWQRVEVPAAFALIRHPQHGIILFDTGHHARFFDATRRLPYRLYRSATPLHIGAGDDAVHQLEQRGIAPSDVRWIIVSHFDPDHIGGLRDFPKARIVCSRRGWAYVRGSTGLKAMRRRFLPALCPDDIAGRLMLISRHRFVHQSSLGAYCDLFNDNSVHLYQMNGHAPGMLLASIDSGVERRMLFCADAVWHRGQLDSEHPGKTLHGKVAVDAQQQAADLEQMQQNAGEFDVVPTHCPQRIWDTAEHDISAFEKDVLEQ